VQELARAVLLCSEKLSLSKLRHLADWRFCCASTHASQLSWRAQGQQSVEDDELAGLFPWQLKALVCSMKNSIEAIGRLDSSAHS
jgi:hypothetical protein